VIADHDVPLGIANGIRKTLARIHAEGLYGISAALEMALKQAGIVFVVFHEEHAKQTARARRVSH
jgi:hypothetical protein